MKHINFEDRVIHQTDDGSYTLAINGGSETYHSRRGAHSESQHVYVDKGFKPMAALKDEVNILEVGFGTGLNALLTLRAVIADYPLTRVVYTALEPRPLKMHEVKALDYFNADECNWLEHFHTAAFAGGYVPIPQFAMLCEQATLNTFSGAAASFDLVYYDAFGPATQPEMWTPEAFARVGEFLCKGGALVTYCAKGQVRRDLESVGFQAERLDGPPGKREMLRAWKM